MFILCCPDVEQNIIAGQKVSQNILNIKRTLKSRQQNQLLCRKRLLTLMFISCSPNVKQNIVAWQLVSLTYSKYTTEPTLKSRKPNQLICRKKVIDLAWCSCLSCKRCQSGNRLASINKRRYSTQKLIKIVIAQWRHDLQSLCPQMSTPRLHPFCTKPLSRRVRNLTNGVLSSRHNGRIETPVRLRYYGTCDLRSLSTIQFFYHDRYKVQTN